MFWSIALAAASGMRTMTPIAVVCWAAYLGYLPVEGTWAFWTAKLVSVVVFTLLALGEYVGDTLPRTPSRTDLPLVAGRLFFAVLVGVVIATSLGQPKVGGVLLGVIGGLIGTYAGHRARLTVAGWVGADLPVALCESALAIVISLMAMDRVYSEVLRFADRTLDGRWH